MDAKSSNDCGEHSVEPNNGNNGKQKNTLRLQTIPNEFYFPYKKAQIRKSHCFNFVYYLGLIVEFGRESVVMVLNLSF